MATKIIHRVLDDIDGSEDADTVPFSLNGVSYEIDLGEKNRERMEELFAEYVGHARRVGTSSNNGRGRSGRTPARPPSMAEQKGYKLQDIREWARSNGYPVGDKGRIPNEVVAKYDEAQTNPQPEPVKATRRRRTKEPAAAE